MTRRDVLKAGVGVLVGVALPGLAAEPETLYVQGGPDAQVLLWDDRGGRVDLAEGRIVTLKPDPYRVISTVWDDRGKVVSFLDAEITFSHPGPYRVAIVPPRFTLPA